MKVLVACEFSGVVRRAFRARGHDAWSCDIVPAEDGSPHHLLGDARNEIGHGWDIMIAHPPCTYLASSGARWWAERRPEQWEAIEFVLDLWGSPTSRVCVENPIGLVRHVLGPATQIIQPWMFGHGETKSTCLWLRGLPPLTPTKVVQGREARVHRMSPSEHRGRERSRTYAGIAAAMAEQWG